MNPFPWKTKNRGNLTLARNLFRPNLDGYVSDFLRSQPPRVLNSIPPLSSILQLLTTMGHNP